MHTLTIVAAGFVLLLVFHLARRSFARGRGRLARHIAVFLVVWLAVSAANMLFGVVSAGYPLTTELPIMLLVFAVPAAAALILDRWQRRRG